MKILLCESIIINKNPKYRIIKYNDEYLIVDLVSSWIVFFLPMINWFIPKNYVKISKEEFDVLNIFKPVRNNAFWPVTGALVLLVTLSKKYIYLLNTHLDKKTVIIICFVILLCVITCFLYLNQKLKLHIWDKNKGENEKNYINTYVKKYIYVFVCLYIFWQLFNFISKYIINNGFSKYNRISWLDCNDVMFLFC
ncbi:DUF443 family protein [Staphylococcus aureus]|uniref:DUF443 family protein n=1 Tax=Staphylococcus aureus TaxID=1280 RepID=UPI003AF0A56A